MQTKLLFFPEAFFGYRMVGGGRRRSVGGQEVDATVWGARLRRKSAIEGGRKELKNATVPHRTLGDAVDTWTELAPPGACRFGSSSNMGSSAGGRTTEAGREACRNVCVSDPACRSIEYRSSDGTCENHYETADSSYAGYICDVLSRATNSPRSARSATRTAATGSAGALIRGAGLVEGRPGGRGMKPP